MQSLTKQTHQGSLLFVTYTIIQGIISSEMLVRTGPLNGKCKKKKKKKKHKSNKNYETKHERVYI